MAKITKKNFEEASKSSGGVLAIIAKRLKVSRSAITQFCKKNEWTNEIIEQENESINDLAESKLVENINKGDQRAIEFRLKTKGKHRGYIERQEIVNSGSLSFNHALTKEEKDELLEDLKNNNE
jgi:hypothetical protein